MRAGQYTDDYIHTGKRNKLVEVLVKKGITDTNVLAAIGKVPRHFFLDDAFSSHAYEDKAFNIGDGQTISHPYTVAYQSQVLQIQTGDVVLEIGTGSGYQTCILLELGARVYTIERIDNLHKKAKKLLRAMQYKNVSFFCEDGSKGLSTFAPYNKIIVTAGAPIVPQSLLTQLAIGGIMVIPIGNENTQVMNIIYRVGENEFKRETKENFKFVPLIGEQAWK